MGVKRVVGVAVQGAPSKSRERAVLFATAAGEQAALFVGKRAANQRLAEARQALAAAEAESREAAARGAAAAAEPVPPLSSKAMVAIVLSVLVGACLMFIDFTAGLVVGSLACAASIFYHTKVRGNALRVRHARERFEAELGSANAAAAERARNGAAKVTDLERQAAAIVPSRKVAAVGRVLLPISRAEIAGYSVLFDRSGLAACETLRIPDLAASPERVTQIVDALDRIAETPMLLAAADPDHPSEMTLLQGEEQTLKAAVESFGEMVEAIPLFEESLPILPKDSPSTRYLLAAKTVHEDDGHGLVLRARDQGESQAIANLGGLASRARQVGKHVDAVLRTTHDRLRSTLANYRDQRSSALDGIHDSLAQVLSRSQLPHVRCYCPKCNRIPEYLFHKLGVDVMTAHHQDPNVLVAALQRDPEVRERITSDPQIFADISAAWDGARELESLIGEWVARQRTSAQTVGGEGLLAVRDFDARLRAMQSQRDQLLAQFRAAMRKAATGNARPLLDLSRSAVLLLDPVKGSWTCTACATTFDDPDVVNMGRMLKVKDELLMPMWNHLWTEKDDFRKAELFRTNEQLQQYIEKESVALRAVSEQYRADMRPVRENLILSSTEAIANREQLDATVESLAVLGVVNHDDARQKLAQMDPLSGSELDELRARAEVKETLLNQEPQAQMNRRIPAIDPVEVLMGPDALFRRLVDDRDAVHLPVDRPGAALTLTAGATHAG